jgi:hypothetical protein
LSPDAQLLEALGRRPQIEFKGEVFRATRRTHDPLLPSTRGGRWAPENGPSILYTSVERDGAFAEIAFHWSQLTPIPRKPAILHRIDTSTNKTLRLIRADLAELGVDEAGYDSINYERTQAIGAAVAFLGCDGLIAPNARWACENLMLFTDNFALENELTILESVEVNWVEWAKQNGFIP